MTVKFLTRYTEQRLDRIITTIWPKDSYASGDRIPTDFDLDEGATSVVNNLYDAEGGSDWMDDWANEITQVDVSLSEQRIPVLDQYVAVAWTRKQVKSAELASRNGFDGSKRLLSDFPIQKAVQVLSQRANLFAVYGKAGTKGLFNASGILEEASTFNPYTADPQLIRGFITQQFSDIQFANNVEDASDQMPDTIDLPSRMFKVMHDSLILNTETNIMLWITKNYSFIKNINFSGLLNSESLEKFGVNAPGTNKDMMMVYKKDPFYLSRQSSKVIPYDVEKKGTKYEVIYAMVNGATNIHQPDWIKRTTFPKG
jgi:hypothetical protein